MEFKVRPNPLIRSPWRLEITLDNGDLLQLHVVGNIEVARDLAHRMKVIDLVVVVAAEKR